jgi:hypothetical protein
MTTLLKNRVGIAPPTEVAGSGETAVIEQDQDLYTRVLQRLANPGETIPAEAVLGPLDDSDRGDED